MQPCAEPPSSEGGHGGIYDDQAARRTTRPHGLRPADVIDNYDIRRGCVGMCNPGAQLADVGRSDPALSGLNYHATTGSGPT